MFRLAVIALTAMLLFSGGDHHSDVSQMVGNSEEPRRLHVTINADLESYTSYYDDGSVCENYTYRLGASGERILSGVYQRFHGNGVLEVSGKYANGDLVGAWRTWYPSGKVHSELQYDSSGLLSGQALHWFSNGQMKSMANFVNGDENGEYTKWDEHGNIILVCNYRDGVLHGTYESYYPDGKVAEKRHYENGKLQGAERCYYSDGRLEHEAEYVGGEADGVRREYSENGQLLNQYEYKQGDKQREKRFQDGLLVECLEFAQGRLARQFRYDNGVIESEIAYSKEGVVLYEKRYSDGELVR